MKPSLFLSSLAAALFLAPVLASAQPPDAPPNRPNQAPPGGQMRRGGVGQGQGQMGAGMGRMQQRQLMKAALGLTDLQEADILKARETAQRDRLRKSADFKIARLDLKSLLRAEKVDDKAIAAKLAEAQAAQGALLKVRLDQALAMKRILTPEQQKKMAAMRGQRTRMRGEMGRGPGRSRMGPGGHGYGHGYGHGMDVPDFDDLDPLGPSLR